eukprot:s3031_g5.t1
MPGPWVQSALDPGWLAKQSYPVGSTVEFVAFWHGAGTMSRVLATVLGTRGRGSQGTWLDVQIRCVEDHQLFIWLGKGGGAKHKGRFDLHLCLNQVEKCSLMSSENGVEVHTDTLRRIEPRDLEERISGWWTTSPTKDDFEVLRARVLAGIRSQAVTQTAHAESHKTDIDRPRASSSGRQRGQEKVGGAPRRAPEEKAGVEKGDGTASSATAPARKRGEMSQAPDAANHESGPGRGPRKRAPAEMTEAEKARGMSPTRGARGTLRSRSHEKEAAQRRREQKSANDDAGNPGRRKRPDSGRSAAGVGRGQRPSRSISTETERGSRPPSGPPGRRRGEAHSRKAPGSGAVSRQPPHVSESEDLMCQGFAAIIGSEEESREGRDFSCRTSSRGQKIQAQWQTRARSILSKPVSYGSVGGHVSDLILTLDGPLGEFTRLYCSTQPPPAVRPFETWRGDVLPIYPGAVTNELEGIDQKNLEWVRATLMVLNYLYCCGSVSPVAVPMRPSLGENQLRAVQMLGEKVNLCFEGDNLVPSLEEIQARFNCDDVEGMGRPVRYLETLDVEKVIAAWPPVGARRPVSIVEMLDGDLMRSVRDPMGWWLPDDMRPQNRTRSEVRSSDETWYKLCQAAHGRSLMKVVPDNQLHKDRDGHYITNGAGGVAVRLTSGGRQTEAQWFVPILLASNEHSERFPGSRDALTYAGLLEAIVLPEEGDHYMESWRLSQAFSAFSIPDQWLPHFAFSKKVCASAFGGTKGVLVRPAWCVLPCGWKNTFTLIEGALRFLVFEKCRVLRPVPTSYRWPRLSSDQIAVDCSDFVAEMLCVRGFWEEFVSGRPSERCGRFESECRAVGLPVKEALELLDAVTCGVNLVTSHGNFESLRAPKKEVVDFVDLSLGLLQAELWKGPQLRMWMGKAIYMASFNRPLLAVLDSMFPQFTQEQENYAPSVKEIEEVICFMVLALQASSFLKFVMPAEISCSCATPTGGLSASAASFQDRSLDVAPPAPAAESCGACGGPLRPNAAIFPCPRACGMRGCSIRCAQSHFEQGSCSRSDFAVPRFGERFASANYPLTLAVAMAGGAVQRPLGLRISDNPWDFFTEPAKEALEFLEEDPALRWRHWSPDSATFSTCIGREEERQGKGRAKNPGQIRSDRQPWGKEKLSRDDQVKIRQENKIVKRCLKGLEAADRQGGFAALLHPYDSFFWFTEEAEEMRSRPGFMVSSCAPPSEMTRDSEARPPRRWSTEEAREADEFPWHFCVAYAGAIVADLRALMVPPLGTAQFDLAHLLYNQIMGSARGMQSEDLLYKLVIEVEEILRHMEIGDEPKHLAGLARHLKLKGSDARLLSPKEETNGRELLVPYPAFRWCWRRQITRMWPSKRGIRVLEMISMLAELRRRARAPKQLNQVYIHVVSDVNCLWTLMKGPARHHFLFILFSAVGPMRQRLRKRWWNVHCVAEEKAVNPAVAFASTAVNVLIAQLGGGQDLADPGLNFFKSVVFLKYDSF